MNNFCEHRAWHEKQLSTLYVESLEGPFRVNGVAREEVNFSSPAILLNMGMY